MNFWKIDSRDKVKQILDNLGVNLIDTWDFKTPVKIEVSEYKNPRSLSQNALLHMWFGLIAKDFKLKNFMYDKNAETDLEPEMEYLTADDVKLMLKHKFLGTKDIRRGKLVIENQLISTSSLDKGEMMHFMDQVYHWGIDRGIQLSIPAESEYMKLKGKYNG